MNIAEKYISILQGQGIKIKYIDEIWWLKWLDVAGLQLFKTIYICSRKYVSERPENTVAILAHEKVHYLRQQREGVWHLIKYAWPQLGWFVLSVILLCLGSISLYLPILGGALLGAGVLACFTSGLPSKAREEEELEAYFVQFVILEWLGWSVHERENLRNIFTEALSGWDYLKMLTYWEAEILVKIKAKRAFTISRSFNLSSSAEEQSKIYGISVEVIEILRETYRLLNGEKSGEKEI